jgi:hypothetical protein
VVGAHLHHLRRPLGAADVQEHHGQAAVVADGDAAPLHPLPAGQLEHHARPLLAAGHRPRPARRQLLEHVARRPRQGPGQQPRAAHSAFSTILVM